MAHKLRARSEAPRKKRPAESPAPPATKQARGREPFPEVPAAPTYYPSEEEFAEPFKYILRIKPEAEKGNALVLAVQPESGGKSDPADSNQKEKVLFQGELKHTWYQKRATFTL